MSAHVISIEAGEDLVAALSALGEAWVAGTGHVEGVELRVAAEATDPTRALRGRWTLVSLLGPATGPLGVSLARSSDRGLEVVGGVLVRGRSAGVSALVTPLAKRATVASADATSSARREATVARPAEVTPPKPVEPASWTTVAEASEEAADEAEIEDPGEPYPVAGDLVDHFSFGLCEVLTSDGDRLRIRDLRGAGRIREVALAALVVPAPTRRDGKRCFRLLRKT